jgi:hypothetical protein
VIPLTAIHFNDDGKPVRTPTIRVHENMLRKDTITKEAHA